MNKILTILFALTLGGCAAKKTTSSEKEVIKKDSIVYVERTTITPAIHDSIYVASPCDSLGNLKPISATFNSGAGKVTIYSDKGALKAKIDIAEVSNKTTIDKQISSNSTKEKKAEEIIRYKTNWKWVIILILLLTISIMINIYLIKRNKPV